MLSTGDFMVKLIGKNLYQWDVGRLLEIKCSENINEVHFSQTGDTEALIVEPKNVDGMLVASIPGILLQQSKTLHVYLVVDNVTVLHRTFNISKREKPSDYVYTETEVKNYEALEKRIETLEKNGVSDERIESVIKDYLEENPIETGATKEQAEQIEKNKNDIADLSEQIDDFTVEGEVHLNLNDEVYVRGYIHNADEEVDEYYQSYKNANYLSVDGGKTIEYFSETTNYINVVEYDYKKKYIANTRLYTRTSTEDALKALVLNSETRYIRFCRFSGTASDMTNAKISIYYSENALNEYTPYSEVENKTFINHKMILGEENDCVKLFSTVLGMKSCTTLKNGDVCETLGYHSENDGGCAKYIITTNADTSKNVHQETISNGLYATLMHDGLINVKQLGAYGNGAKDDSVYIQKAINIATNGIVIPKGRYIILSKVYVTNKLLFSIYANEATIINKSDDYAFSFSSVNLTNCYFNDIVGEGTQSGGLEFYAENNSTAVQYMNVHFKHIKVTTNCIYIHGDSGWISELRFHGGRFEAHNGEETAIGCVIDCSIPNETDANTYLLCDHISFYNIGIEGIKTGFHFKGKENLTENTTGIVQFINIIDCRSLENFDTLLRTEGYARHIKVSTSCLLYAPYFDLSEKTSGFIEAPCTNGEGGDTGGTVMDWNANIFNGVIIPNTKGRIKDDATSEILDLSSVTEMESVYSIINLYHITSKIKLTKQYGMRFGVNDFMVRMIAKNPTGVTICDYEDNVICDCSNINEGDIVRFMWNEVDGWYAEKLNTIVLTTS